MTMLARLSILPTFLLLPMLPTTLLILVLGPSLRLGRRSILILAFVFHHLPLLASCDNRLSRRINAPRNTPNELEGLRLLADSTRGGFAIRALEIFGRQRRGRRARGDRKIDRKIWGRRVDKKRCSRHRRIVDNIMVA